VSSAPAAATSTAAAPALGELLRGVGDRIEGVGDGEGVDCGEEGEENEDCL
jgi:hypothetical protein